MSEPVVVFETYTGDGRICAPFNQLVYKGSTPLKVGDKFYLHPDPRVAELEAVLRECRDAMNAVSNGVIKPPLMTEQAFQMMQWQDFLITAVAKIDEVLK